MRAAVNPAGPLPLLQQCRFVCLRAPADQVGQVAALRVVCIRGVCPQLRQPWHFAPCPKCWFRTQAGPAPPTAVVCWRRPIALFVRSPAVLAVVSQVSVWFVIIFAVVVAVISMSPELHSSGQRRGGSPDRITCTASAAAVDWMGHGTATAIRAGGPLLKSLNADWK